MTSTDLTTEYRRFFSAQRTWRKYHQTIKTLAIQRAWRRAVTDPAMAICRTRLRLARLDHLDFARNGCMGAEKARQQIDIYFDRLRRMHIAAAEFQAACCVYRRGAFVPLRTYQHALFNWLYHDMEAADLASDPLVSCVYRMCHAFSPTTEDGRLKLSTGSDRVIPAMAGLREFPTQGDGRDRVIIGLDICEFPTRDTLVEHGDPKSRCHPWDEPVPPQSAGG